VKTLYTAVATATDAGRNGRTRTDDGKLDLELSMPEAIGGPGGDGTNPEQLFAAGYAACFANAMRSVARREGREDIVDGARPTRGRGPRGARARALPVLECDARQHRGDARRARGRARLGLTNGARDG
jgi:organic hydroperoxide reductase OsmC/OhrA